VIGSQADEGRLLMTTVVVLGGLSSAFARNRWRFGLARAVQLQRDMLKLHRVTTPLLAIVALLSAFESVAQASGPRSQRLADTAADQILGYWQRGEGEAILEVRRLGDGYHGVIVSSERQPEAIGTEILRSLRYDAEEGLWRGRVYSMSRDKEYTIEISVPDSGRFVMTARVLFIRRSVQFNRLGAATPSETRLARR
jgi:uncharacterized protein (DUF2147 family)